MAFGTHRAQTRSVPVNRRLGELLKSRMLGNPLVRFREGRGGESTPPTRPALQCRRNRENLAASPVRTTEPESTYQPSLPDSSMLRQMFRGSEVQCYLHRVTPGRSSACFGCHGRMPCRPSWTCNNMCTTMWAHAAGCSTRPFQGRQRPGSRISIVSCPEQAVASNHAPGLDR